MLASRSFLSRWQRSLRFRAISLVLCVLFIHSLAVAVAPVPSGAPSTYPSWWFSQGLIPQITPNPQPAWPVDYPRSDDYAAANVGELKQIATKAAAEMNANPSCGAGQTVNELVASWTPAPATADDYAALTLGQLKNVVQVFYDQLIAAGYTNAYPWTISGLGSDDYAVANVGQLKYLFSFDLTYSTTGDGVPDWWAIAAGLNPNDPSQVLAAAADGATNPDGSPATYADEYEAGVSPLAAATPPGGSPPPAQGNPLEDFPNLIYVAVDVSDPLTNGLGAAAVAIDDQNNVGFMYFPIGNGNACTMTLSGQTYNYTNIDPSETTFTLDENPFTCTVAHNYTSCNASGGVAGYDIYYPTGAAFRVGMLFTATNPGAFTPYPPAPDINNDPFPGIQITDPGVIINSDNAVTGTANMGNSGLMFGNFNGYANCVASGGNSLWFNYSDDLIADGVNILPSPGTTGAIYWPSVFSPAGISAGYSVPNQYTNRDKKALYGVCIGVNAPTSIGHLIPLAVSAVVVNGSNYTIVIGDNPDVTNVNDAISISGNGAPSVLLSSRLPAKYIGKLSFPRTIQLPGDPAPHPPRVWINSVGDIVIDAMVANTDPTQGKVPRTIIWYQALTPAPNPPPNPPPPPPFAFVNFPQNIIASQLPSYQFNKSDIFAGLDSTAAVVLLPVTMSATNVGFPFTVKNSNQTITDIWMEAAGLYSAVLSCPLYQVTATMPSIPGLPLQLNIIQDFTGTLQVTYQDTTSTQCLAKNPSNAYAFLADDATPPAPVQTTTTTQGITTAIYSDSPNLPISAAARPYITGLAYSATPKDFVTVQNGTAPAQAVAEIDWKLTLNATFKPSGMTGPPGTFPSIRTSESAVVTPLIGATLYGGVPAATPVPKPRTPTANTYITGTGSWNASGGAGTYSNTYRFPLPPQRPQ